MISLEIGYAKTDITPQSGRQTIYHRSGQLDDEKTPVRDMLYARATAFRGKDAAAIWVTADLLCVDTRLRNRVAYRLKPHGVAPEAVALSATHTHTAPTVTPFHGVDPTPEDYLTFLEDRLVHVALEALRSAGPAQVSFGKSSADLSVNRREIGRIAQINNINSPSGLVDKDVTVAVIEMMDDARKGALFNYAAHPLTMSRDNPQISADYPGRAVECLEVEGGLAFAQFLQGCAGDVNVKVHGDDQEAIMTGRWLAQSVLEAVESAEPSGSPILRSACETVRLPWAKIPTREEARRALEQAALKPQDRSAVEWAKKLCRAVEAGEVAPHAEVTAQALRVHDGVFVALPGEVFAEIGLAIKRQAGVRNLFVAAYSNNCEIGYIPTGKAFSEGGYEVDQAPFYYGLFRLSPECEKILVEAGLRTIRRVWP